MGCGNSKAVDAKSPENRQADNRVKELEKIEKEPLPENFEEFKEEMSRIYNIPPDEMQLVDEEGVPITTDNYGNFKNSPTTTKQFSMGDRNSTQKSPGRPKAFVYGPKKVATRFMKNSAQKRIKPAYNEDVCDYLIDVDTGYIETFNFNTSINSVFNNSMVSSGARAVFVPPNYVLVTGGKESPSIAFSMDLITGETKKLDSLFEGREYHAMVYLNGIIYVTGGAAHTELDSCEMYLKKK